MIDGTKQAIASRPSAVLPVTKICRAEKKRMNDQKRSATRIVMFTGKGGVGKTTLSAASALLCMQDRRTLLLSTDPAGSLGEIFGRDFTEEIVSVAPQLDVVELSRKTIIRLWHETFAGDIFSVLSSFLPVEKDILNYIEGAPGIDEEFTLSYLLNVQQSGRYDAIVWDAAPTSTTLKLLELQKIFYTHLTDAQKLYLKFRGFFKDANPVELISRWRQLTQDVIEMLKKETSAWIVANPERLPVEQALMIASSLRDFGIRVNGYAMNKLLDEKTCDGCDFFAKKLLSQKRWHDRLASLSDRPIIRIPELAEELNDPDALLSAAKRYNLFSLIREL
jgi:arsenite-transporting ATPase